MAGRKITVVLSQSQGKNPARRHLEEELAAQLMMEPSVDVSIVPHLYDLTPDHTGLLFLRSVGGDIVVLSWLYPRAAHWILDRNGVKGRVGTTLLVSEDTDEDEEPSEEPERHGIGAAQVPNRHIYCIDLRSQSEPGPYLEEIRRISREQTTQTVDLMQWIQGSPKPSQLERYLEPRITPLAPLLLGAESSAAEGAASAPPLTKGGPGGVAFNGNDGPLPPTSSLLAPLAQGEQEPEVRRRWYPVIDYDRCTNCMECIDFCLFGVYGVDQQERILVEYQENCKKGCPACSRVCPENAILFPGHKEPAIAGADGEVAGLKIDLSKLFGGMSALETAAQERDTELVRDGRDAVGLTVGIPKRQPQKATAPRDDLDDLMDGLDQLNF